MVRSGVRPSVAQLFSRAMSAVGMAPPRALVGERGVDVPVGDHHRAALQGRVDDLGDVLGPVGGVQQGLAVRRHAGVGGVEQQRAQPHPDLGRAGLVGGHDVVALLAQPDRDQPGLRGLAHSLAALEREEQARPGRAARCPSGDGGAGMRLSGSLRIAAQQVLEQRHALAVIELPVGLDADEGDEHRRQQEQQVVARRAVGDVRDLDDAVLRPRSAPRSPRRSRWR